MHFAGAALAFAVALMMTATGPAAAQLPSCASKLIDCRNYLNATTTPPPSSCCGPLNSAVKDDLPCLCALFNNTEILKAFNVNITQALHVAKLCGADTDPTTACASISASPPAGTPPSSSSNSSGSGSPSSKNGSSAHGMTSIGFSGLLSLLLFSCWSVLAQA